VIGGVRRGRGSPKAAPVAPATASRSRCATSGYVKGACGKFGDDERIVRPRNERPTQARAEMLAAARDIKRRSREAEKTQRKLVKDRDTAIRKASRPVCQSPMLARRSASHSSGCPKSRKAPVSTSLLVLELSQHSSEASRAKLRV